MELLADRQRVEDILVRLSLIQSNESIRVEELAGGVSSTILKIEGQNGTYCLKQALPLLKVSKTWSAPVERVYAEIAWLQLAATIVPGCSPTILGVDHPTNSFVMEFLPPEDFLNWKSELIAGKVTPCFAAAVGQTLVRLHGETANREEVRQKFSNDLNFFALRLDPYLLEVARMRHDLSAPLHLLVDRTQTEKRALVHGDVSPKNVLVSAAGPVFLDAECACYGDPAFDVAFCLNHLLLKSIAFPAQSALLLEAFDAFAGAYLSGVNWEAKGDIEGRISSLLPALMLARIWGKSPVEYLNALQCEVIVKIAVPLVSRPPADLQELKEVWKRGTLPYE